MIEPKELVFCPWYFLLYKKGSVYNAYGRRFDHTCRRRRHDGCERGGDRNSVKKVKEELDEKKIP
jgi:hypothetical protein